MKLLCLFFVLCLRISSSWAWDLSDFKTEALSPVTTKARNILYVGAGLTITVLVFEDSIVDYTQNDMANDQPLGSLSKFGDLAGSMVPNLMYSLGMGLYGSLYDDPIGSQRAWSMLKASGYAGAVSTVLKYSIREPRPGPTDERNSFPSGHSTTAFAFAGYVYEEHGWQAGVPALLLATFVAASRINDNRHYLHDVLAGSTIGAMYGVGISIVDREKRAAGKTDAGVTIVPFFDHESKGLALYKEF
jgi:hypothetical protein